MAYTTLFADGFDAYATAELTAMWTNVNTVSGSNVVVASPGFSGSGNFVALNGVANPASLTLALGTPEAGVVVGFRYQYEASGFSNLNIFTFQDNTGAVIGNLAVTASGQLVYINNIGTTILATSGGALSTQTWTYLEAAVTFSNSTSGAVQFWINNVSAGSVSGANTSGTNPNLLTLIGPLNSNTGTSGMVYDDIYILTGSSTRFGPVQVLSTEVNGDGRINQWAAHGAGSNYLCVNQYPPDGDTTYVFDATVGDIDDYTMAPITGIASVLTVMGCAFARDDNTPARTVSVGFGNGTTESFDAGTSLNQTYTYVKRVMDTNPITSSAWAVSDITNGQVCVKVVA